MTRQAFRLLRLGRDFGRSGQRLAFRASSLGDRENVAVAWPPRVRG